MAMTFVAETLCPGIAVMDLGGLALLELSEVRRL